MVKLESYLAIEESLGNELLSGWKKYSKTLIPQIHKAMEDGDVALAVDLANGIDLTPLLEDSEKYLRYISYAAMLFGASQVTEDPKETVIVSGKHMDTMDKAMTLFKKSVVQNVEDLIRDELLHQIAIGNLEDPTTNFGPSDVIKGDRVGHPFRGNQYVKGSLASAQALAKEKLMSKIRGGDPNQTGYHHSVRVSASLQDHTLKVIGMLHDIVEDSDVTVAQLREEFGDRIANAVDALTKDKAKNEPTDAYMARLMANVDALRVKIADMSDNMVVRPGAIMGSHMKAKQLLYAQLYPKLLEALAAYESSTQKYDEDQPRDKDGKWTASAFSSIAQREGVAQSLMDSVQARSESRVNGQPWSSEEELYKHGEEANAWLKTTLNEGRGVASRVGCKTVPPKVDLEHADLTSEGGMLFLAPLKSRSSAERKVKAEYGGDWGRIQDLARASIVVDTLGDVKKVIDEMARSGVQFAKPPSNRFAKPGPDGYRDAKFNLVAGNGMIVELQVHVKSMIRAKEQGGGHLLYERMRVIRAKYLVSAGSDEVRPMKEWPKGDRENFQRLLKESARLYGKSWKGTAVKQDAEFLYFYYDNAYYRKPADTDDPWITDVLGSNGWSAFTGDAMKPYFEGEQVDVEEKADMTVADLDKGGKKTPEQTAALKRRVQDEIRRMMTKKSGGVLSRLISLFKGEGKGHPFRGNQYVKGVAPRNEGETDKAYAKRVIDHLPSPKELPSGDLSRYFNTDVPGTQIVPVDEIESSKTDEENAQGGENGPKRLRAAYDGLLSKRDPITVKPHPTKEGKYLVVDGNGTLTSAKKYNWPKLPVIVLEQKAAGFLHLFKANPHHDDNGRFTTKERAVQAGHKNNPTVQTMQQAMEKVGHQVFEDEVTRHIASLNRELSPEDFAHEIERVARRIVAQKYDENQPRDKDGRWSSEGTFSDRVKPESLMFSLEDERMSAGKTLVARFGPVMETVPTDWYKYDLMDLNEVMQESGFTVTQSINTGGKEIDIEGKTKKAMAAKALANIMKETVKELPEDVSEAVKELKPYLVLDDLGESINGLCGIGDRWISLNAKEYLDICNGTKDLAARSVKAQEGGIYSLSQLSYAIYDGTHGSNLRAAKDAFKSTAIHEIGHLLTSEGTKGRAKKFFESFGDSSADLDAIRPLLGSDPSVKARDWIKSHISEYATYNSHEFIAESFLKYHRKGYVKGSMPKAWEEMVEMMPYDKIEKPGKLKKSSLRGGRRYINLDTSTPLTHKWEVGSADWWGDTRGEGEYETPVQKADVRYVKPLTSFRDTVQSTANDLLKMTASLHSSRLSAYGFTVEANYRGLKFYKVNERLDSRICPVCRIMHGKRFKVSDAVEALNEILSVQEPDDLRTLQPWPKQDKKSVEDFGKMSNDQLVERNWHVPPYHPGCRGLLGKVDDVMELPEEAHAIEQQPTVQPVLDTPERQLSRRLVNSLLERTMVAVAQAEQAGVIVDPQMVILGVLSGTQGRRAKTLWRDLLNYYSTRELEEATGVAEELVMLGRAIFD